jgi:anthranilate phosphoribosyltransferase
MTEIHRHIRQLLDHHHLSQDEMARVMQMILMGGASPIQISTIVAAIEAKTPSHLEIYSIFDMMRRKMHIVDGHDDVMNIVIGSNSGLENEAVSITVMFILAALECRSAKLLNKICSNAHDIFSLVEKLGCQTDKNTDSLLKGLDETYLSFYFSPNHSYIFRDLIQVMQDLKFFGVFDISNSLLTPVNSSYHLIGLENEECAKPLAETLGMLGAKCAWVVSSPDLGDIISPEQKTSIVQILDGSISSFDFDPASFDFLDDEREYGGKTLYVQEGNEVSFYSEQIYKLLQNQSAFLSFKKIVLLNATAAIMIRGLTNDMNDAMRMAKETLSNGNALSALHRYVASKTI